ncbi:hypothetical protein [Nonomuraea muscovyensis]|uniref:hypothetical protein n=1 Tax=Nonomuraea muscovyensis TaxID=1124761 RepID=UPI0035E43023
MRALEREVSTPQGRRTVRADSVRVDAAHTPEGALQATQHHTPQYVHQPRYLDHPNGAVGLHSVLLVVPDGEVDAHEERYARMLDADVWIDGPGACCRSGTAAWRSSRLPRSASCCPGTPLRPCPSWPPTPSP